MLRKRHVLTDTDITRQVTLQLPGLDFCYMSDADGPVNREAARTFCAKFPKIARAPLSFDGIVRVDFYPSRRRLSALNSWDYGASRQYEHASYTEPLCLVVLQNFIALRTTCEIQQRDGQAVLVITDPHIAMYGKADRAPEEYGQMLPVPTLPQAAAQGYVMTYENDVEEVVVSMDSLLSAVKEYEG